MSAKPESAPYLALTMFMTFCAAIAASSDDDLPCALFALAAVISLGLFASER